MRSHHLFGLTFLVLAASFAQQAAGQYLPEREEEEVSPFQPLFVEDPERKPIPLIPAEGYYQVATALAASPESGYRWERWGLHPDGRIIGRMASAGRIASRRLIDPHTGDTIGYVDCSGAPLRVALIDRYGRPLAIDLCMAFTRETPLKTPYPLYRVISRGVKDEPLDVDPFAIGWLDDLKSMLTDGDYEPVARLETVRLSELGARTSLHSHVFAATSLTTRLLASPASNDLLRRIEEMAAGISPSNDLPTKLLRVELTARWLQAGAALITDKNATALLSAERIETIRSALAGASLTELNFLWKEPSRQMLWDSLGAAHPFYRLYAEAVQLAELNDDAEVLEHTLRVLKAAWIFAGGSKIQVKRQGPFEDWMQAGLLDAMDLQAVRTTEDALALTSHYRTVQPSTLTRPRGYGDPSVVKAYPPPVVRAANQAAAMDRAIYIAAALQRGGHDVTLWSVSVDKIVDDVTKTKVQQPLIVFPREQGKPELFVLGDDAILKPLNGKRMAPGYYQFPALGALQPLLVRSAQFQVSMVGVLEAQSSLSAWIGGIQSALIAPRLNDPSLTAILLEHSIVDPWERYNQSAVDSLATLAQSRFVQFVRDHKVRLQIKRVVDGKDFETLRVVDIDKRPADQMLPKHEATLGRCLQALPPKFEVGLKEIDLRTEPILEPLAGVTIENGKIKVEKKDRIVIGRASGDYLILSAPMYPQAFHEMMHRWGNSRSERYSARDWRGTLVEAFNEISWEQDDELEWQRRTDVFKIEDFWWEYGATNEREDFAVIGQFYGTLAGQVRARVRSELKKGNFVPAAKYLYFKMIAFLDADGRSIEIDIDDADKPFTVLEFEKAALALEKQGPLTAEQIRVREVIRLIRALNKQLRETKATGSIPPLRETRLNIAGRLEAYPFDCLPGSRSIAGSDSVCLRSSRPKLGLIP